MSFLRYLPMGYKSRFMNVLFYVICGSAIFIFIQPKVTSVFYMEQKNLHFGSGRLIDFKPEHLIR